MFRLIYRQRRRLSFGVLLVVLTIFVFLMEAIGTKELAFADGNGPWLKALTVALTLLFCAFVAFVAFSLWLVVFPSWRFMIEQMALFMFSFQAFQSAWPEYVSVPYIGEFLPLVVGFTIVMNVYGTGLDRFPISLGMMATRRFKSKKSAEQLWADLVPLPENKDAHWDTLLKSIEADPEADQQTVTYNHGASVYQFQRQTFTELEPPFRATYRFDGDVSEANKPITGGTYEILIEPQDDTATRVTLRESHDALLPRIALQAWFDDDLGDRIDALRARERGKRGWALTARYRRKVASLS